MPVTLPSWTRPRLCSRPFSPFWAANGLRQPNQRTPESEPTELLLDRKRFLDTWFDGWPTLAFSKQAIQLFVHTPARSRLKPAGVVGLRGMPPNHWQRFIDQHPALFAAILPAYLVLLWLLVGAILSFVGGWFSLSKLYRTQVKFEGAKWRGQSARMRWLVNYNHVLTLGANREGLYLASMFLFRFMHPPLLIPWREIKLRRGRDWFLEYVTFTMGHEVAIPLKIRAKLAEGLKKEAGNDWPVEEL